MTCPYATHLYNELEYRLAFERAGEPDRLFSLVDGKRIKRIDADYSQAEELGSVRFTDFSDLRARQVLRALRQRKVEFPPEVTGFEYARARRLRGDGQEGLFGGFFADYNVRFFRV